MDSRHNAATAHLRPALKPTFLPLPAMLDNLTQRLARVVKTMRGEAD
jgi:hypothetical protein